MEIVSVQSNGQYNMNIQHGQSVENQQETGRFFLREEINADSTKEEASPFYSYDNLNHLSGYTQMTLLGLEQNESQGESPVSFTSDIESFSIGLTPLESHISDYHAKNTFNYLDVISSPQEALENYRASYDEFLEAGQEVVEQMQAMDDTGLLQFRYTAGGPVVDLNEKYHELASRPTSEGLSEVLDAAQQKLGEITDWIESNRSEHDKITEKGLAYAYARAAADYEASTGISRDDAIGSGADAIEEFTLTVNRYAANHYGVNAMTEAESTARFGEPRFTYVQV